MVYLTTVSYGFVLILYLVVSYLSWVLMLLLLPLSCCLLRSCSLGYHKHFGLFLFGNPWLDRKIRHLQFPWYALGHTGFLSRPKTGRLQKSVQMSL